MFGQTPMAPQWISLFSPTAASQARSPRKERHGPVAHSPHVSREQLLEHDSKMGKAWKPTSHLPNGGFRKWGCPPNGFLLDNPIKMDDLGVPLF